MVDAQALRDLEIVYDDAWPSPSCPHCSLGHLDVAEPTLRESAASLKTRVHDAWEAEWISGSFTVDATCGRSSCKERAVLVGAYRVEMGGDYSLEDDTPPYRTVFQVEYATPALRIMDAVNGAPQSVMNGLARAAAVLYADPPSAANALRVSVERFLTSEGVLAASSNGAFVSTHKRILRWQRSRGQEAVGNCLLAVKWIGNEGSHEASTLTVAEVLDGAEILEYAFKLLFDKTGERIVATVDAINAAKGLVR